MSQRFHKPGGASCNVLREIGHVGPLCPECEATAEMFRVHVDAIRDALWSGWWPSHHVEVCFVCGAPVDAHDRCTAGCPGALLN